MKPVSGFMVMPVSRQFKQSQSVRQIIATCSSAGIYGFHRASEIAAGVPAERSEWLALDLMALNDDSLSKDSLPLCPAMLGHDTLDSMLGALYVVEGGWIQKTGATWRGLLSRLDNLQATAPTHEALIESAVETFSVFEMWLNGWSTSDVS